MSALSEVFEACARADRLSRSTTAWLWLNIDMRSRLAKDSGVTHITFRCLPGGPR